MIANYDVWRAAEQMLTLYGPDADTMAIMRADHCLDQGDTEGCDVWALIVSAIKDLRSDSLPAGVLAN